MFGTYDIFQFHRILLGLKTDLFILPQDLFARQVRDVKGHDFGVRIRGDDGIALALVRDGQGHQRGMPTLAR